MKFYEVIFFNPNTKKFEKKIVIAKSLFDARKKIIKKYKTNKIKSIKHTEKIFNSNFFSKFAKVNQEELISILHQMYVMLDAGLGIDNVIKETLNFTKNPKLKMIFEDAYKDINNGLSLSESLSKYEKDLGNLVISMIKVGEETGELAETIKNLANILEEIYQNKKALKKSLRYPLMVFIVMMIAFSIIITFVIPPFKKVFESFNSKLPLPTLILLKAEYLLTNYGGIIALLLIASIILIKFLYNHSSNFKYIIDTLLFRIYIINKLIYYSSISRFTFILTNLLKAGIPIIISLDIAIDIIENAYIKKQLEKIKEEILKGNTISAGFIESKLFEGITIQMIKSGEESGSIVPMLEKISEFYAGKYKDFIANISTYIEPLLLFVLMGFVLLIALGVFLPMWDLASAAMKH